MQVCQAGRHVGGEGEAQRRRGRGQAGHDVIQAATPTVPRPHGEGAGPRAHAHQARHVGVLQRQQRLQANSSMVIFFRFYSSLFICKKKRSVKSCFCIKASLDYAI